MARTKSEVEADERKSFNARKDVEEKKVTEESVSTASELKAVDSYDMASGNKLTEVETGNILSNKEPETTSVQSEKRLSEDQKKVKGKSNRDIISITGKYTRRQPMTSIRRIESFDVADDEGGSNKKKLSYEQVVANIEEGQIYSIVDSNGDSSKLKVINTPWGKVITTEKDNSEVNNINGPHLEEFPLDPETEQMMEAEVKAKKEKDSKK